MVGIDIVTRRLPQGLQKLIALVLYVIILCALVIIIVFGIKLSLAERIRTYQSIPIPYSLVTLSIVVTALSMIFSTILKIRRSILDFNVNLTGKEMQGGTQ